MGPLTTKQRLQLFRITADVQRSMCLDELAFITLMRICRDYAMPSICPAITGTDRDEWLRERLNKFRIRFFGRI